MDKKELDKKISETAKSILSYCIARTSNQVEAEDLAQDIIVEIYKSALNIRNPNSIYSFMWAVAANVYKQWCRKKARYQFYELDERFIPESTDENEDSAELYLLRRELTLLHTKYRKAVILYYIENKSCSEISDILSISESMVKYLLFKSRQILKEGMKMERNYGEQSYNPKKLSLLFWGNGENCYYHLCDSIIAQNILFACYNDKLSAEQISLEIGVALPYMEEKLNELSEFDLLKKDGNKYYTNIILFTKDFTREVNAKTGKLKERIADIVINTISEQEIRIRNLGFTGANMSSNSFAWQMTSFILYHAIIVTLQSRIHIVYPKDKFGNTCFVWGIEKDKNDYQEKQFLFGISNIANANGDLIQFMDFPINGEMVHHYFFDRQNAANIFLDIANGTTNQFSQNDLAVAAEMVQKGYVISVKNGLTVNTPVFTKEQYASLKEILSDASEKIAKEAESLMDIVAKILKNHVPVHLKKQAKALAYLRLFEDAISAPTALLVSRRYLFPHTEGDTLPTTYVLQNI